MLYNLDDHLDQTSDRQFDICIVGAGAAGITLANELLDSGLQVALIEGGGLFPPGQNELDLYQGAMGERIYPLAASRLRYLGGSTNHWGGWCRMLDTYDFEEKPHHTVSSWPIKREDLIPYYERAHQWVEIERTQYNTLEAVDQKEHTLGDSLSNWGFVTKLFRFSPPTRFGSHYRQSLTEAENIALFIESNAVGLIHNGSTVGGVQLKSFNGAEATIKAKRFVLAMGGVENARFLLNTAPTPDKALGNGSDFLGRCFMDHFGFTPSHMLASSALKHFRHASHQGSVLPVLSMSDSALRKHALNNFSIQLIPDRPNQSLPGSALLNPGFSTLTNQSEAASRFRMIYMNEPTPNPNSRITLQNETDAFGVRRLKMDWKIHPQDFENIERVTELLAKALGESGQGRLQYTKKPNDNNTKNLTVSMHHMGTTRMAQSMKNGVVDPNCKVFACDNLYVAGSSVFPSSGFSNPTLTIVALAVKLADHLAAQS